MTRDERPFYPRLCHDPGQKAFPLLSIASSSPQINFIFLLSPQLQVHRSGDSEGRRQAAGFCRWNPCRRHSPPAGVPRLRPRRPRLRRPRPRCPHLRCPRPLAPPSSTTAPPSPGRPSSSLRHGMSSPPLYLPWRQFIEHH